MSPKPILDPRPPNGVASTGVGSPTSPTSASGRAGPAGKHQSLGRTAAWLAKHVEIGLGTVDLSLPQYRVLVLLDESSARSSDLAERLAVRPPSVTSVVDGLVTRGLVERRNVASDRRRVDHLLTAEGHRTLAAADAAVDARLSELADCAADASEADRAFEGLLAWRQVLRAWRLSRSRSTSR